MIREALDLYQTAFRKPSFTVYCLDYSGSMKGDCEEQLKSAMRVLLDPEQPRKYFLQPSAAAVSVVLPFRSRHGRVDGQREQQRRAWTAVPEGERAASRRRGRHLQPGDVWAVA